MAIDLPGLSSINAGTRSKVGGNTASPKDAVADNPSAKNTQTQPETVKFSSEAQMLSKLEDQLGQLPDTNQERLASIKQAIQNGSFSVNPERIAEKLTSLEGRLFS
tara:strand:- start:11050 stop:11367 length:318 start_codon:yes stop_codon:yes gene_type:complete